MTKALALAAVAVVFSANAVSPTRADAFPSRSLNEAELAFSDGYLAQGGPAAYLPHLLDHVRPCEGEFFVAYSNGFLSAFQFTPGTWHAQAVKTGAEDPLNPFDVGANVAALILDLEARGISPGTSAGWPACWWATR